MNLSSGQVLHSSQGSTKRASSRHSRRVACAGYSYRAVQAGRRRAYVNLTLTAVFRFWQSPAKCPRPAIFPHRTGEGAFEWTPNNAVDYGIIGLLLALSVWSVAIAVERWLYYSRIDLAKFGIGNKRWKSRWTEAARRDWYGWVATRRTSASSGRSWASMSTFYTMERRGPWPSRRIMIGLSLALKATAVAWSVAIPCVVMNNILCRK